MVSFNSADFQQQVIKALEVISFTENIEPSAPRPYSSGFEESEREAREITERSDIKNLLCPALQNISSDAFEIANGITPVLVGAVLGGTLSIPLNPILFAWIALIIFRMGVATFCGDRN